jgi:hypothetical protein
VILGTVVLTTGIALASVVLTVAVLVAIAGLLGWFDRERHAGDEPRFEEPDWWPEFERKFADYVSSRD